jgi:hypothetical protein
LAGQQLAERRVAISGGRIEFDRVPEFLFSFRQLALPGQRLAELNM